MFFRKKEKTDRDELLELALNKGDDQFNDYFKVVEEYRNNLDFIMRFFDALNINGCCFYEVYKEGLINYSYGYSSYNKIIEKNTFGCYSPTSSDLSCDTKNMMEFNNSFDDILIHLKKKYIDKK